jgi:DNA polymerase bacteriophage-type
MIEARADFETRSDVDLKTRGAANYFASPHFKALIASYRIGTGPLKRWRYGQPCPPDLAEHIRSGGYIRAFNASFERQCIARLAETDGWPLPAIDRYRCTAAEAAAMALPRKLAHLGEALNLDIQKDKEGERLIRKFSIPRRPRADEPPGVYWNEPEDHPADFDLFVAYCDRDVETEEAAAARLVPLSDAEQALYTLDQVINTRGIRIDRISAIAALNLAEKSKALLNAEMAEVTGGAVRKCTEPAKLVEWVKAQGVELTSAAKADIIELLEHDDIPDPVRKALEIRQEAAKTSVSKLKAMLARASDDGRVRGSFLYHGASTGRWTSMGVNFANLPRPRRVFDDAHLDRNVLFDAFRQENPEALRLLYGDDLGRPLHLISDALRSFVWAAPGCDLLQADYSGIEGAVIAWLAGEDWKLKALFEIATDPSLPDLYRRTAAAIMNTTTDVVTKKHPLRQSVGKVSELALGFGGGVAAFYSMSQNYGVKLGALYAPVWETADEARREKAAKRYENAFKKGDSATDVLTREEWLACEIIKVGWRAANPAIAKMWADKEGAMRSAVAEPGEKFVAGRCAYMVRHGFLWTRLPSGRCLAYAAPRLRDQVWVKILLADGSWSDSEPMDRDDAQRLEIAGKVKIEGRTSSKITVLGVAPNGKMMRQGLYGGLIAENDTQAAARDLLTNGMLKAELAGYPVVAHVYDEIITEVPHGFGDLAEFERLICELPEWAAGLPLTADGWRGKRYRKD